MSKRILSLVLALVMVLGTFGAVFAAETGSDKIDWLVEQGMVKGNESGDLMLESKIDRASTARMIAVALGLEAEAEGLKNISSGFKDMTPAHWANGYANLAAGKSLIVGDQNGNFMPAREISYAEVTAILVRLALGRDLTAEERANAGSWAAPYVAKASELGLFDGVSVPSFDASAIRKDVLEMFYNAMMNMEVGNYSIIKGIVLENYRVEKLDKDTVLVEVLKEIKKADYVEESRDVEGDQVYLTIDAKVGDVEDLLGRVADFTVDKNNKVVAYKLDETYKIETGVFTAKDNKISRGATSFTVNLPERYSKNDETIFRTYYNNTAYAYETFYQNPDEKDRQKEFDVDYAKVTVKNGRVLFIDAFNFEDIAPVKEVKDDGAIINVYNDARDGGVKRYDLAASAKVLTFNDGAIGAGTREDIEANDVIHEFKGGYIVRKDSAVNGTYEKVSEDRYGYYVHVDGEEYEMLEDTNKQPVYSYDSKEFYTLKAKSAASMLREFKDEKVTILIDVNGNLQYIGSEIDLGEFAALISNVVGRDARVVKPDNTKAEYSATLDSYLSLGGRSGHQNLNQFNKGDLVYLVADGEDIDTMVRLVKYDTNGLAVVKDAKGDYVMTRNYIETDKEYKVLDRTNVFVRQGNQLVGTTIEDVLKKYDAKKDVEAFVLTDKAFTEALKGHVSPRREVSEREDIAHTIIFTDIEYEANLANEVAEVTDIITSGRDYELRLKFDDRISATRLVKRGSEAYDTVVDREVRIGDVIRAAVSNDDDRIIEKITVLIEKDAPTFEVKNIDWRTGYRTLTLADKNNSSREFWLSRTAAVFGNLEDGAVVTYSMASDEINAIYVKGSIRNTRVTGDFHDTGDIEDALSFDAYLGAGRIRLGGTNYIIRDEAIKDFIEKNEDALAKAQLAVNIVDGEVTRIIGLVLNQASATIDGDNFTVAGDIVVNGNNTTIKSITAKTIYQHVETLTLEDVNAEVVDVNAEGTNTLTLKGDTKVATINVNKKHVVKVESSAKVTTAINIKAEGTKVEGNGEIKKVVTEVVDFEVPAGTPVEAGKTLEPKVTKAVAKAVYNEEGKYDITFDVEAEDYTDMVEIEVKDAEGKNVGTTITNVNKDGVARFYKALDAGKYEFTIKALVTVFDEDEEVVVVTESEAFKGDFELPIEK